MKLLKRYPIFFFSRKDKVKIVDSIRQAEMNTSGEIRVHVEGRVKGDFLDHAKKVFERTGMTKTMDRNGVLIILSISNHEVAILGDQGINQKVPPGFWDQEIDLMKSYFKKGDFTEGVSQAVLKVGEKLKAHFPYLNNDRNELPNKISY